MKKYVIVFLICTTLIRAATAQSLTPRVVASAGNFATSGNYSLSYTIGEAVVPTFSVTNFILTQGFQQNDVGSNGVTEVSYNDLTVKIYPNPASDYVNVLITADHNTSNMQIHMYDLLGRDLKIPVANYSDGSQHLFTLNLSGLTAAMYFITVNEAGNNNTHTFKINKITP